jgi:hypothetical protein
MARFLFFVAFLMPTAITSFVVAAFALMDWGLTAERVNGTWMEWPVGITFIAFAAGVPTFSATLIDEALWGEESEKTDG